MFCEFDKNFTESPKSMPPNYADDSKKGDEMTSRAFCFGAQRKISGVDNYYFVKNTRVADSFTAVTPVLERIRKFYSTKKNDLYRYMSNEMRN